MRIAIVTDAWAPQVNGVVRTLQAVRRELEAMGHQLLVISPDWYRSVPCPTYPEIRLAMARSTAVGAHIAAFGPDAIHLATEGPLCVAARRWCLAHKRPFTTAYHTQFPEYLAKRTGLPAAWFWRYIRWFHAPAEAVLVSTSSIARTLQAHGVAQTKPWGRGVDLSTFTPAATPPAVFAKVPRPIQLYVGRVAIEKNLEAFLSGSAPGTRVVVGHGPARADLARRYPTACFMGSMTGSELAGAFAGADVFVFPSRTDTFGLVIIEALACGTPVAAYPVNGPLDILTPEVGAMRANLDEAIVAALPLDRNSCSTYARRFSWQASARQFLDALAPVSRLAA
jgi:glycosyltransferase involved in cell wall biosynthesis